MAPKDSNCIFCKIVDGDIPSYKVYEDEHVMAFLDVGPLSHGHTLVIPKGHWVTLDQVPEQVGAAIGKVLPKIAKAVCKVTGIEDYNILQNNGSAAHQAVGHVHFHIIPKTADTGLGIDWPAGKLEPQQASDLLAKIKASL